MPYQQPAIVDIIFWLAAVLFFTLTPIARRQRAARLTLVLIPLILPIIAFGAGTWTGARHFINWIALPHHILVGSTMMLILGHLFYRTWTQRCLAVPLAALAIAAFVWAATDPHVLSVVREPDNIPIALMLPAIAFFLWVAFRRMAINDDRTDHDKPVLETGKDDRVLVWPDLVLVELLIMLIATILLFVWAILVRAPLEAPANPAVMPNPAKAPWYFVGLQELLVYFDPWIAGALLPVLIIIGLCALPYLDRNRRGNGYYTLKQRPVAIPIFLFAFLVLWITPILIGTFLRGPNWAFFGPFESWATPQTPAPVMLNLSDLFWTRWLGRPALAANTVGIGHDDLIRELPGFVLLLAHFMVLPLVLTRTIFKHLYSQMGFARYTMTLGLLCLMALIPLKMLLRWLFNIKYILAIPDGPFNI